MFGLSTIKAVAVTAGVMLALGTITTGVAYFKGRGDGRELCEAAHARAAEAVRQADIAANAEMAAKERERHLALEDKESKRDEVEADLLKPEAGDDKPCIGGSWLRGFERFD